jgi:hypothetical protein
MAYSYRFVSVSPGTVIRRSDGLEFPADPASSEYQAWLAYTAGGGVTAPPPPEDIDAARAAALADVNSRAADARARITQHLGDDDLSKWLRFREAHWIESDVSPEADNYPLLAAEIPGNGADLAAVGVNVRAELAALNAQLAQIETLRAGYQAELIAATTAAEIATILAHAIFPDGLVLSPGPALLNLLPNDVMIASPLVLTPFPAVLALVNLSCAMGLDQLLTPAAQVLTLNPLPPTVLFELMVWTDFEQVAPNGDPAHDDRIIYVSSSVGSDANSGLLQSAPKRTIAAGKALMRSGHADWLLLKRGDLFTNETLGSWNLSGRNTSQRMLVGNYGSGARPILDTNMSSAVSGGSSAVHDLAFTGFECYPGGYTGGNGDPTGFYFTGLASSNILVEDVFVHDYAFNFTVMGTGIGNTYPPHDSLTNFQIRGCTIWRANGHTDGGTKEGIYAYNTDGLKIEFCTFDRNGWIDDQYYNFLRRNLYIDNVNVNFELRNSLILYTDGIQMRSGGVLDNVVASRCNVSFTLGAGSEPVQPGGVPITVNRCVAVEGIDCPNLTAADAAAFVVSNVNGGTIANCAAINSLSLRGGSAMRFEKHETSYLQVARNLAISNFVAHNWSGYSLYFSSTADMYEAVSFSDIVLQNPTNDHFYGPEHGPVVYMQSDLDGLVTLDNGVFGRAPSSTRYSLGAYQDAAGSPNLAVLVSGMNWTNCSGTAVALEDPTRTLGRYNQLLGGANDHDAFAQEARLQERANWRPNYTAPAAGAYLLAGLARA